MPFVNVSRATSERREGSAATKSFDEILGEPAPV